MKKTEALIVVEKYFDEQKVDIDRFYSIRLDNHDIVLQGYFNELNGVIATLTEFKMNDLGHVVGEMTIPENVKVRIILT